MEWTVAVGSTINRAHQHAAGACKKADTDGEELEEPGRSQARQALGRARDGLTTRKLSRTWRFGASTSVSANLR